MIEMREWSEWVSPLVWTVGTLTVGWLTGHFVGVALARRGTGWMSRRRYQMAGAALRMLRTRLPWWGLLAGIWLSSGYWPLTTETHALIGRAVFVAAMVSATLALAALASESVDAYAALISPALPVSSLTRHVAWSTVAVLGLLVVLNSLGLSITPMLTALGVGGLAVALALQEPLANFFAGVFIALAGQIRVGDYVKLDSGQEGYVVDFSWRSTRLRMLANNLVLVPNAKLAQAVVVNHHLPSQDLAVLLDVGVDYASDLNHVERVVEEVGRGVMREVAGGVPAFDPFIRYHTFGDSSVNFTVILRAQEFVDQYLVKHEFMKRLHARFNREGIAIPFPIQSIAFRNTPPEGGARQVSGAA